MSLDVPADWHLDYDEEGRWIDDSEPSLSLADLLAPSPALPKPEARRKAAHLLAERTKVVVQQRRAATNGYSTRDLAAHLAVEAAKLWDRAEYLRRHRRELCAAEPSAPAGRARQIAGTRRATAAQDAQVALF